MIVCPVTGRLSYEPEDIEIGEIYKCGKKNYLVKDVKPYTRKIKNYKKEDIEKYGEKREVTSTFCFCKDTKDLNGQTVIVAAGKFEVNVNEDKQNKILYTDQETMSDIISSIENKEDYHFDEEIHFKEDDITFRVLYENKKIIYSLIDSNGDEIVSKGTRKFDFSSKLILKNKDKQYSIVILNED